MKIQCLLLASLFASCVHGFGLGLASSRCARRQGTVTMAAERPARQSRRELFRDSAAVLMGVTLALGTKGEGLWLNVNGANAASEGTVAVLGARGRTARLIINELLRMGKSVRAVTREPFTFPTTEVDESLAKNLEYATGDVTRPETLGAALKGASAVVFASSASKKGGNAEQVDYQGVVNAAQACLEGGVSRYLVISSGAVSRPDSFGYKITNIFGGIMTQKIRGEDEVRRLYASAPKAQSYTIVRPGGLSNDKPRGVTELEINQGDTIIGEISRADVADACVNALLSRDAENATFEVYETKRRAPLQPDFPSVSGLEHNGDTWADMLKGLKTDAQLGILPKSA